MGGYITWIAVAGLSLQAMYHLWVGDTNAAARAMTEAIGFLGLGRKIERNGIAG